MSDESFPLDYYLGTLVRILDTVHYDDNNYTHEERVANLKYAYSKAAKHFAQPHVQETLNVSPKRLAAALQTIVGMVVYAWVNVSKELMADLSIHYTYTLLLDDSKDKPAHTMQSWYQDLLQGKEQQHGWWRLVNDHFPKLLNHYGPYCQMNLVRSTVDFFQGCWIEQSNFKGFYGSHDYPGFLRRMNGLGHCVGSSLWPTAEFNEDKLFLEVTTAIAQMENWMVWVNDLFSFYKEYDAERDQTSLVQNYCETEGISINDALEKLCSDTVHSSEQLVAVFEDKDEKMVNSLRMFVQGYITWHLCDKRYRLSEVYEKAGDTVNGLRFKEYCKAARSVGIVNPNEYAIPSVTTLAEQARAQQPAQQEKESELTASWGSWGLGLISQLTSRLHVF